MLLVVVLVQRDRTTEFTEKNSEFSVVCSTDWKIMKIHEFQAKKILSDFGMPVPMGESTTEF